VIIYLAVKYRVIYHFQSNAKHIHPHNTRDSSVLKTLWGSDK